MLNNNLTTQNEDLVVKFILELYFPQFSVNKYYYFLIFSTLMNFNYSRITICHHLLKRKKNCSHVLLTPTNSTKSPLVHTYTKPIYTNTSLIHIKTYDNNTFQYK